MRNWKHEEPDWYNYRSCVEETARIAGIYDIKEILTEEELYPKLYQWFDVGIEKGVNTYAKENDNDDTKDFKRGIAIWPFAGANAILGRSPSVEWWRDLVREATRMGYATFQFGHESEQELSPLITSYKHKSFFQQVKIALACKMSIGTDSGNMWVMGAYGHPAIHLLTNWLPGHVTNCPLSPPNRNSVYCYAQGGTDNIKHKDVLSDIERMMNDI
jgi:ADP-heptose:LPS heptosyltransferase